MNTESNPALKTHRGSIIRIKSGVEMPLFAYKNRFCGLPNGMSNEPLIAAMFSKVRTGRMYFSAREARNKIIVSGTKIMSETSFVTNIDEKKTQKTKKKVSARIDEMFFVFRRIGSKIFSLLKPSSTESSIKSVASVRQLMSEKSAREGGVIKSETAAATSETESMMSFLKSVLS